MVTIRIALFTCLAILTVEAQQNRIKNWPSIPNTNQPDSLIPDSIRTAFFTIGSDYANRVLFCGRDFGERQFGISPYVMYNFRSGLYGYVMFDFWSATPRKPARHVLGIGYESDPNKRLSFQLGYERWFNHYEDSYFDNALKHEIEVGLDYKINRFSFESTFYYFFGLERIYELDLTLSRPYRLLNKRVKILITPEFTSTFATPVFSWMFYEFPDPEYDYEKFRLVDFEGGTSLTLERGNLELVFSGRYNAPVRVANEVLSPFFYLSAEVNLSF
jgi:hypothetical protein